MRFTLLIAVAAWTILASGPVLADDLPHIWSTRFGNASDQQTAAIAVDGSGDIFVTGRFQGIIDFGGGPLASAGGWDIYLAKFNSAGAHLWSMRFGDGQNQYSYAIALNGLGQPVIVGSFQGSVNFGTGPMTSAGGYDVFVAKFHQTGTCLWSRRYGDSQEQFATGVGTDSGGMVTATGYYYGSVDFGGGPLPSAGGADIFLFRLDSSSGFHQWSQRFGDNQDQVAIDLATVESARVAITGYANGTVDFGGGPLTSTGGSDMFVAAFQPSGSHLWSRIHGGAETDAGSALAISPVDFSLIVTGAFRGSVSFGGAPLVSAGGADIFLAKYSAAGAHLWSARHGGNQADTARDLALRGRGDIALTGYFEGTADFGGGGMTSAGQTDLFIAVYDPDGQHLGSRYAGDAARQEGEGVAYTQAREIICTGQFEGAIDLGGGLLTSAGSFDPYLAKLGPQASQATSSDRSTSIGLRISPNPASGKTKIDFTLARGGSVLLQVFDPAGRFVGTLVDRILPAGHHSAEWSMPRRTHASGVYVGRLVFEGRTTSEKILILE